MIALPGLEALGSTHAGTLLGHLMRASVAGGLFVAAVWLVTRFAPRLPASLRCALWWAAGLKLLLALLWVAPVEFALLPAPEVGSAIVAAVGGPGGTGPGSATELDGPGAPGRELSADRAGEIRRAIPWRGAAVGLWLLGVAFGAFRLARGLRAARQLRSESRPADDPVLVALFDGLRRRLGVAAAVELRLSDRVPGPLTLGPVRSAVVLPARDLARLSREELEMALAHELLHVRRRDLWAGWVPRLARYLFFFHPLAALAEREYHLAREAACDAAVLRELGTPPRSYGRLLLLWGGRRPAARLVPDVAAAGASSSFLDLKRRLEMLQNPTHTSWRWKTAGGALAGLALAALLPLRIVAQPPTPPELPAVPELPSTPEPPEPPEAPRVARAALPESPAPPAHPRSSSTTTTTSTSSSWSYLDDGEAWALLDEGDNAWMSGDSGDMRRIKTLRAKAGGPILWFRRDGQEYVVRDEATLARAREILEPQRELGRRQGELGARQGELGADQGKLGEKQGQLGAQQGQLGAKQAEFAAQMAALAADHARLQAQRMAAGHDASEDFEAQEAAIEEKMHRLEPRIEELGRQQEELGRQQEELGHQQEALGSKQEALGAQQEDFGRQQEEAARRAQGQLRELFDDAIARGLAERVE